MFRKLAAWLTRNGPESVKKPLPSHTPVPEWIAPVPFPAGVRLTGLYITHQGGMRAGLYDLFQVTPNGTHWKITDTRPGDDSTASSPLPQAARYFQQIDTVLPQEYASVVCLQDETPYRELEALLVEHGALSWDGYDENDPMPGVLDSGDRYELYLTLSDGSSVSMKGYNACPAGFMPLLAKVQALFDRHSDYSRYLAKQLDDAPCNSLFLMVREGMYTEFRLELRGSDSRWVVVMTDPYGTFLPAKTAITEYGILPGGLPFDRFLSLLRRHGAERWNGYYGTSADSNHGFTIHIGFTDGKKFEASGSAYPDGFEAFLPELIREMQAFYLESTWTDAPAPNALLGRWYYGGTNWGYFFGDNGTGAYHFGGGERAFTYRDDGHSVEIYYPGETGASRYSYTIAGNDLRIQDSLGNMVCYKKREEANEP